MSVASLIDENMSSRELVRALRVGISRCEDAMPESLAWHAYLELRNRDHDEADDLFMTALRNLHRRRSLAGSSITTHDPLIEEHRLTDDVLLGELWKAYKKCIKNNRTGPAGQLLKEIEDRLQAHPRG